MKRKYTIRYVDCYTMLIESEKKKGAYTIMKAKYFKGLPINEMPSCYIVEKAGLYAHGETIKKAMADVQFKYMRDNIDASEIIKSIKKKGVVTVNDYRLLTGACQMGCDNFLKEKGIKKDFMPIKEACVLVKNAYGGSRFIELMR